MNIKKTTTKKRGEGRGERYRGERREWRGERGSTRRGKYLGEKKDDSKGHDGYKKRGDRIRRRKEKGGKGGGKKSKPISDASGVVGDERVFR